VKLTVAHITKSCQQNFRHDCIRLFKTVVTCRTVLEDAFQFTSSNRMNDLSVEVTKVPLTMSGKIVLVCSLRCFDTYRYEKLSQPQLPICPYNVMIPKTTDCEC
jgi:hypothetical protein